MIGRAWCRVAFGFVTSFAALSGAVCSVAACGSSAPVTAAPVAPLNVDRTRLVPIALPDLSNAGPPVQKQLREGYQSLVSARDNPASTDAELGRGYGEMGKLLMAAEYRDLAEQSFLNAQTLASSDQRWPYYLAHLYTLRGDSAKATAAFERALQLKPEDLPTLVYLGSAYLDAGKVADADRLFTNAAALAPRSVPVLFGLGRTALAKQEYAHAVDLLEQALSLDPKAVVIHYPLAMAYRGMGDLSKAEAHLRVRGPGEIHPPDPLMLEVDSLLESAVAYEVRGAQALDRAEWAAAADYFRKAIALAPDEPSLRHKLGTALAMQGDPHAPELFEEITRRWPKFPKAHYSLGLVLASGGHPQEAINEFTAAVTVDPTYSEARLQLAETLRAQGRYKEALPHYEETMTLNPRLAEARIGYGMAFAGLHQFDQARVQFTEGARIFPDHPQFAELLSRLPPPGSNH